MEDNDRRLLNWSDIEALPADQWKSKIRLFFEFTGAVLLLMLAFFAVAMAISSIANGQTPRTPGQTLRMEQSPQYIPPGLESALSDLNEIIGDRIGCVAGEFVTGRSTLLPPIRDQIRECSRQVIRPATSANPHQRFVWFGRTNPEEWDGGSNNPENLEAFSRQWVLENRLSFNRAGNCTAMTTADLHHPAGRFDSPGVFVGESMKVCVLLYLNEGESSADLQEELRQIWVAIHDLQEADQVHTDRINAIEDSLRQHRLELNRLNRCVECDEPVPTPPALDPIPPATQSPEISISGTAFYMLTDFNIPSMHNGDTPGCDIGCGGNENSSNEDLVATSGYGLGALLSVRPSQDVPVSIDVGGGAMSFSTDVGTFWRGFGYAGVGVELELTPRVELGAGIGAMTDFASVGAAAQVRLGVDLFEP